VSAPATSKPTTRTVRPFGERAFVVSATDASDARTTGANLRDTLGPLAASVLPGMDTVVVTAAPVADLAVLDAAINSGLRGTPPMLAEARTVTLPVAYDGEDLTSVADLLGLSTEEVVARHTGAVYEVAMLGFAPGFPYLTGLDPVLTVPRLDVPRTRVPAGAVGLAAGQTCVYPSASPGGWRLIGHTDTVLFDPTRPEPALLAAGDQVRFTAVTR
jgi:KipI family sensor histidine kinase inhibitor